MKNRSTLIFGLVLAFGLAGPLGGTESLALAQAAPCLPQAGSPPSALFDEADRGRLERFYQSRAAGLREALVEPDNKARAMLAGLLAELEKEEAQPKIGAGISQLEGNYACRTLKLGRGLPLVIYDRFSCTITLDDGAARLEKTTGSQRLSGILVPIETSYLYVGAGHYDREKPREYGDDETQNEVGCLNVLSPNRLLLELPEPKFESDHDFLLLERR